MTTFDATVLLGGGVADNSSLTPWAEERCNLAVTFDRQCDYFLVLTQGTVYKPYPMRDGWPVFDAEAMSETLLKLGIKEEKIIRGTPSRDTIGDAFFARIMHTDVRKLRNLLIITSDFHMPRTKQIFDWIFGLDGGQYQLTYRASKNVGIEPDALADREQKEANGRQRIVKLQQRLQSLEVIHRWLYEEHGAYRARPERQAITESARNTY